MTPEPPEPPRREVYLGRGRSKWWRWIAPASAIGVLALGVSIALLAERDQPATTGLPSVRQTPLPPQAWLDDIARLKSEGRGIEAAEQLAQFRKAYPAYAVPESLRGPQ